MAGGEGVVGDEGGELGGAHLQGLEAMVGTFSKYDGKPWRVCRQDHRGAWVCGRRDNQVAGVEAGRPCWEKGDWRGKSGRSQRRLPENVVQCVLKP